MHKREHSTHAPLFRFGPGMRVAWLPIFIESDVHLWLRLWWLVPCYETYTVTTRIVTLRETQNNSKTLLGSQERGSAECGILNSIHKRTDRAGLCLVIVSRVGVVKQCTVNRKFCRHDENIVAAPIDIN